MNPKLLKSLTAAVLLLAALSSAEAEQTFTLTTESFADANGNGLIDCGETVDIRAVLYDNSAPVDVTFTGRLTIPSNFPNHFSYASFEENHPFTSRCQVTNVVRDIPGGGFTLDYSCTGLENPNRGYILALRLHGAYTGPSGTIQFQGTNDVTSPTISSLNANYLETRTKACPMADLQLTKSDGGLSSAPGRTVPYNLSVVNRGNSTAASSVLSETVPASTSFDASASSAGWACSPNNLAGATCTLALGNLVVGGSASRIFAVTVGTNVPPSVTQISNTATVTSSVTDANPADNTATDTTPLAAGMPDLSLRKTTSSTGATPGSTVTWTLTVTNSGNAQADNVAISETLPVGTAYVASLSSAGWSCSGASCTSSLGSLAAGASVSRQFAVRIVSAAPASLTSITNTACASTTTANEPTGNNCGSTTTTVGGSPRLQISKSVASGTATPGTSLVWVLNVSNTGDRDAGAVTVHETVPVETTFDGPNSNSGWSCPSPAAGSACSLTLPSLAGGGGSASLTFATRINNPLPAGLTSIDNTACASTSGSADACTTISIPSDGSPNPSVVKRLVSGNGAPGSVLVFGLTVQNTGNQDAPSLLLTETVPDNTTWVTAQSSPDWSCSGNAAQSACSLTIGVLPGGGGSVTRTFAVRVDDPLPAGVTSLQNTACVSSRVGARTRPRRLKANGGPCNTVVITPTAAPVLEIRKALTGGTATAGQTVVYTLTISNTGNQNAANVAATDAIPAGTTFAAASSPGWTCSPTSRAPSSCSLAVGALTAGASITKAISFLLDSPLPSGQAALQNQACVSDGSRRACASTSDPILPSGQPVLSIRKTYTGGPLRPGALLAFHLLVTNSGNASANGVRLQETVPAGVVFSAADSDPAWACAGTGPGSACSLPIATLAAGVTREFVFAVRAPNPLPPNVRQVANSACLLDSGGSSLSCDSTSTPLNVVVYLSLDDALLVDNNHDGFLSHGDTLRYTLVVKNTTDQAALAVTLTTRLDPHVALLVGSVVTNAGSVFSGNHVGDTVPTILLPTLAPGASVSITFDVLAQDLAGLREISSQATASGSNLEDQLSDDPGTPEAADPTRTPLTGVAPTSIPTLGEIGLTLLGFGLCGTALFLLRKRPA